MVLGGVRQIEWDWPEAISSFTAAMRLKPNLARARRWYGGLILQFRRFDEAVTETKRAIELDPYDRSGPPALGMMLTLTRDFAAAEDVLLNALAARNMVGTRLNLAQLYAWLGHINAGTKAREYYDNAIANVTAAIEMQADNPSGAQYAITDSMMALFHTMMGNYPAAQPYLEKAEGKVAQGTLSPVMVAKVYAARGDHQQAIDLLNQAAEWHDRRLLYINITPFFDYLHGQPGFNALLKRMQLE
jgi:tetratricopeptide (TPR) repeat protein